MTAHGILVNECLLALSERGILAFKNNTGEAWAGQVVARGNGCLTIRNPRLIKFGLSGSTDIIGFLPNGGRGVVIECKTGTGRLQKNQCNFRTAAGHVGAIHIVARSVEQMLADLDAVLA